MSIELKQAAEQVLEAFDTFGEDDDFASLFALTQKMNALRTALTPQPVKQPADVTDEQIAACVKRASTYGLPFVGLLNPGGAPSEFSKRFTAEILALRPVQVPMTDEVFDLICNAIDKADTITMEGDYMLDSDDCITVVRVMQVLLSVRHGITAQAKKEQA